MLTMLVRFLLKGMGDAFWITNPTQHRRTIRACSVNKARVMNQTIVWQALTVPIVAPVVTTVLGRIGTQPPALGARVLDGATLRPPLI